MTQETSNYKIRLGRYGEKLAADFLIRRGYKIIDKNFFTNYGEIDLIAQTGEELALVEVKTRTKSDFGFPELAVDKKKISHLLKAAQIYLHHKQWRKFWRLDIISIEIDQIHKTANIRQFENVESN